MNWCPMSKQKRPVPDLGHPLIETHCHLDYLKAAPTEEIIATARAVGVERFVTIAVEPDNFDAVRTLAHSHAEVWGTQGVHPHEASKFDADAAARELSARTVLFLRSFPRLNSRPRVLRYD